MLNFIISGTPGTGKSSLVEKLKPRLPQFNYINVSKFAVDNGCIAGFDKRLETQVIDENKLLNILIPILEDNRLNIIESIHSDFFADIRVDWVFVCRADNTKLFDRLKLRGYNENKISNNLQAEIFQCIYDEAIESYGDAMVTKLQSDTEEDLEKNMEAVIAKINSLLKFT